MRKKIIVFLLMSVILVSSLLVSASADTAYYRCILPLTVEWRADPSGLYNEKTYDFPIFPTTLNHDRNSIDLVVGGTDFGYYKSVSDPYYFIFQFVARSSTFHTSNVDFYAPYGFGSPESFYDVRFNDTGLHSEYTTVTYSYYITSNDPNTRSPGERVEVQIDLSDIPDGNVYPFRSLMTFYGGADVIFISDFSLMFSNEVVGWVPHIYVRNYYQDYDWSFFYVTEIMEDRLSVDPDVVFDEGYDVGLVDGYNNGYVDGYAEGSGGISFTSWIGNALSGFFDNFSFGGFNLGIVFFVIISILLILAVVKLFS